MTFRYDGNTAIVATIAEAVAIWEAYRTATAGGVSDIGNGGVVRHGRKIVAQISYNGRVWDRGGRPMEVIS